MHSKTFQEHLTTLRGGAQPADGWISFSPFRRGCPLHESTTNLLYNNSRYFLRQLMSVSVAFEGLEGPISTKMSLTILVNRLTFFPESEISIL